MLGKDRSYAMRWLCAGLAVMLSLPVVGAAQQKKEAAAGQAAPAAQSAGNSTAPAGSPMVDPNTYVIGADDSLQVTVWKEPSFSGSFPVRPDGMISMVMLGDIRAAGRTPTQLSDDIAEKLKKYIQDPVVSVVVLGVNSQKIFLVGEVAKTGPILLTPGMTPLQAIATAGGPTMFANTKHIYILRTVQGKQQKIPFNYKKALKGENTQVVELKPGDTIVIP